MGRVSEESLGLAGAAPVRALRSPFRLSWRKDLALPCVLLALQLTGGVLFAVSPWGTTTITTP